MEYVHLYMEFVLSGLEGGFGNCQALAKKNWAVWCIVKHTKPNGEVVRRYIGCMLRVLIINTLNNYGFACFNYT